MRTLALIGTFSLGLALASCASRPALPPAAPPPAPPPGQETAAPEQRIWQPSPSRFQVPDPSFAVALLQVKAGGREPAAERAARTVTLLSQNHLQASLASAPTDLPGPIGEAAEKAAAAHARSGGKEDIFILGEIRPGPMTQVRLGAVDLRTGKLIGDAGYQAPSGEDVDEIIREGLKDLLGKVDAYWRSPERLRGQR